MHSIGDRVDMVAREHQARHFPMPLGHSVHIAAHVQAQVGHVEHGFASREMISFCPGRFMASKHSDCHAASSMSERSSRNPRVVPSAGNGELIMAGRHRRMGCEYASLPDRGEVADGDPASLVLAGFFLQQFQCEQAGVALVHVETIDPLVAERAQHAHSAHAQHDLLTETIAGVATIKNGRQLPVPFAVFGEVSIQQIDRDTVTADSLHLIFPAAQIQVPSLDGQRCSGWHLRQKLLHIPLDRLFRLPPAASKH